MRMRKKKHLEDRLADVSSLYSNLWVDCSSTMPFSSPEVAKRLIRAYGADRVLFGTDYPMWSPVDEMASFRSLGLTDEEMQAILHDNAIRAYKLK